MAMAQQDPYDFRIRSTLEEGGGDDDDDDADDDHLKAVFGQQWRVHWVTPLWDVQYTEARLKQYALHLRGALQSDVNKHVDAKVTALPDLRRDESAPIPLQISVETVDSENRRQCVYNGIMLSWTKPHRPELENCVHLPLLLCRGGMKAIELVHATLHVLFNCSIKDLRFEAGHMLWMIGIAAHFHDEELDDLHLRFNCPGLGDENVLDFTIQISVLQEKWRSIHGPDKRYITYDEITSLRDKCYTSLEETYGVRVKMLQLIRIKWKGFSFAVKGHIKFPQVLTKLLLKFVEDIGYGQENNITGMFMQHKSANEEEA